MEFCSPFLTPSRVAFVAPSGCWRTIEDVERPSRTAFKWRPGGGGYLSPLCFPFLRLTSGGCFALNVAALRRGSCVAALVLMREEDKDKEAKSRLKLQEREAGHLRGHPVVATAAPPWSQEIKAHEEPHEMLVLLTSALRSLGTMKC